MARFKLHPDDPEVRARVEAFFRGQAEQRFASQATASAGVIEWVTKHPWSWPIAVIGLSGLLAACTRPASGGVIPSPDGSPTLEPSHTPTGTADYSATHPATHTATLSTTPPPATELLVAPPATSAAADASPTADVDSGLPDFDTNDDGTIDAGEMTAGVAAIGEWFSAAMRQFADGKDAPLMTEQLAHLFGHNVTTLQAEAAVASGASLIDLQWVPDHLLDPNDPTVANGLTKHDGVGILTTGAQLSETMARLSEQVKDAGEELHDPDSAVSTASRLQQGLTDQLGLENLWRSWLPAEATDEIGLNDDMCVKTDAEGGRVQRMPVVVEAGIKVGEEYKDSSDRWHVSPDSPMTVVARLVHHDELRDLQELWRVNGEQVEVAQVTPDQSVAVEVYLGGNKPGKDQFDGAQLVFCGRPEQGGVQPVPSPSVTPTAPETPRPQGGGQPPATEVPRPKDTHIPPTNTPIPSATPRPTNTPVVPTEAPPPTATPGQPDTEIPSRTPLPTVTPPDQTETPALVETPKATLTQISTPERSPTPSAPLFR